MKNKITKLALRKETLRALVAADLARVVGGKAETGCELMTMPRSGCPAVAEDIQ